MELDFSQTGTANMNQTQLTSAELAKITNNIVLIAAILAVLSTEDNVVLASSYIKVIASFLSIGAALLESKEQQISPGVTTPLNQLKTVGTIIISIGAIVLTYVLQREIALRRIGIVPPTAPVTPVVPPAFTAS